MTGVPDYSSDQVRTINLIDPEPAAETLRVLGRCDFTASCLPETSAPRLSVATRLELINGPVLNLRLNALTGTIQSLIDQQCGNDIVVSRFYMLALSRAPTDVERLYWLRELDLASDSDERRQRIEDFVWSLLNCQDFITNH